MRISFNTPIVPEQLDKKNGYGYATDRMLASLKSLGYEVTINDPTADVGLCFNQPHHWKFYGNQYKIGYHPWESTQLLSPGKATNGIDWKEAMNSCDEIWTPSSVIADWYTRFSGVTRPVYVYEHGVDDVWTPVERKVDDKFKFLHIGAQAARKGGRDTMVAFRRAFPNNTDVELNMKIQSQGWTIGRINRINIINEKYELRDLVQLYHDNHAFVYPSYGEGFGLTPLEAMATGMPTITVPKWAPYADFLDPKLTVDSKFTRSPWPKLHPGIMLKPNEDDIVDAMRYAYENYEEVQKTAMSTLDSLKEYYNWNRLTKEVFQSLESRLNH